MLFKQCTVVCSILVGTLTTNYRTIFLAGCSSGSLRCLKFSSQLNFDDLYIKRRCRALNRTCTNCTLTKHHLEGLSHVLSLLLARLFSKCGRMTAMAAAEREAGFACVRRMEAAAGRLCDYSRTCFMGRTTRMLS